MAYRAIIPQRHLPEFPEHIKQIRDFTEELAAILKPPFLWHMHSGGLDLNEVHFTADFIVTVDNLVLFLEGGPPHEMGAHMCCFEPGKIDGIALHDRNIHR